MTLSKIFICKKILFILFVVHTSDFVYSQFSSEIIVAPQGSTQDPRDISGGDLDHDGDIDILVAAWQDDEIYWFPNDGTGTFLEQRTIAKALGPQRALAYHIDGDNYIDVISAASKSGELVWYKNDSLGNFSSKKLIGYVNGAGGLYGGDLDNDNDIDIIATAFSRNKVVWFRNDGDGNFSSEIVLDSDLASAIGVIAVDIDADQDLDVVALGLSSSKVKWYENDGSGNFSSGFLIGSSNLLSEISAVDFEEDGYMDILVTSIGGDFSLVYRNNKDGSFERTWLPGGAKIAGGDINKDGYKDIFISSAFGNQVAWFEGKADGSFRNERVISNLPEAKGLLLADFDGDDFVDVAASSRRLDKVTWYRNIINDPSITGTVFWDINENGNKDAQETILQNVQTILTPNSTFNYTNQEGLFSYYLDAGEYNLAVNPNHCWETSIGKDDFDILVQENKTEEISFGFKLISDLKHTQVRINSPVTRCGFTIPFNLTVENDGCMPSAGQFGIVLDRFVQLSDVFPMPSDIRDDTLIWEHRELINLEKEGVRLNLEIAGSENIGSFIKLKGLSYLPNEMGVSELVSTYDYSSEIRCAFDPNDKLVTPSRASDRSSGTEQNYTLFDESLEYTIRFQNTGNDTAFTVVLEDQLDANLDWSTFQPIVASHTYEVLLDSKGLVTFTFSDILLPDSTTNESLSHGFISYKIAAKQNLNENTLIENSAAIFFDFNSPIITNTTNNVMVSFLPTTTTNTFEQSNSNLVKLYPNPFDQQLFIKFEGTENIENFSILFYDLAGKLLQSLPLSNQETSTNKWEKGLYVYKIINAEGNMLSYGNVVKF